MIKTKCYIIIITFNEKKKYLKRKNKLAKTVYTETSSVFKNFPLITLLTEIISQVKKSLLAAAVRSDNITETEL